MRKWFAVGTLAACACLVAVLALTAGGGAREAGGDPDAHGARFEVKDPDKDAKPGVITPAREAYLNRAFPRGYISAAAVQRASRATRSMPYRLKASQFRAGTRDVAARAAVGADWAFLGPQTGFAPSPT